MLEQKLQELSEAFGAFKTANDARVKKIEEGKPSADLEAKTNEMNGVITKLEGEIKGLQTAVARGNAGGNGDNKTEAEQKAAKHSSAMVSYLRKGNETELKAMSVDSDEDGGFLVTPQMSSEIVKKVYETSPIRQLASVMTISTDALEIMEDLDEVSAGWVGETQARTETSTAKLKKLVIPVHEIFAQPKATQKLLDDAAVNVESWLADKIAEKFQRMENTSFVSGDGNLKPKGFLSYDNGTGYNQVEQKETAGSAVIVADDLIALCYKLKGAYKNNAVFLAKRETVEAFRKFKDTQGRYLWEPGLNGAAQSTLLGHAVHEADDMQANLVAGNIPVAFGDFKQGYQIVDRVGIRVIRDIFTAKPNVLFYTTKRVGGAVKNFEAIKLLKLKA